MPPNFSFGDAFFSSLFEVRKPELSTPALLNTQPPPLVIASMRPVGSDWADLKWWIGSLIPLPVGFSPLRDWFKHAFPRLWPWVGGEADPDSEAGGVNLRTESDGALERLQNLLTVYQERETVSVARKDAVRKREDDLRRRERLIEDVTPRWKRRSQEFHPMNHAVSTPVMGRVTSDELALLRSAGD
ncbi:hypothetical protein BO71DRAFT_427314 [Aspergillus ellipticus CBS 707.79]|uniref:Uncharacterized protein n=1 Tax=Aspergillus ellipticus CBS 707.79 TaxID=1448320 RepID=A0A319E952_9EURO|nr:hypothetical protein BO71DRAFT_427314 [Aspergillus ellipticus CBS 707.79]